MFYISVSNGLLKDGHRQRMGEAVWEFMWLLDHMTRIDGNGYGWVLGGKPVKLAELATDLGVHRSTISRSLSRLQEEGYVDVIHAPYGLVIRVCKARKVFGEKTGKTNREVTQRIGADATRLSGDAKPNIRQYKDKNSYSSRGETSQQSPPNVGSAAAATASEQSERAVGPMLGPL